VRSVIGSEIGVLRDRPFAPASSRAFQSDRLATPHVVSSDAYNRTRAEIVDLCFTTSTNETDNSLSVSHVQSAIRRSLKINGRPHRRKKIKRVLQNIRLGLNHLFAKHKS